MHVQQIRQVRVQVTDGNGRTRIEVQVEPEADAETLSHAGRTYRTLGNGVFDVPESVGNQIIGGLFRDLTGFEGNARRQAGVLSSAHKAERPTGQAEDAELYHEEGLQVDDLTALNPAEVAAAGLQTVEVDEEPQDRPNLAVPAESEPGGSLVAGEQNEAPQNPQVQGEAARQTQGAQHTQKAKAKKVAKKRAAKKTSAAKKAAPTKG